MREPTIHHELRKIIPAERVLTRLIDRYAFASDASFYYKIPLAVVRPMNTAELQSIFKLANRTRTPVAFRAAGTSLSGQAVTDGILVDLSMHWRAARAEKGGHRVWVQPGIVGNAVNLALRSYGRKIGPDPASINAAMMGGILANNSSGMCCGVKHNSYHTLHSIRFMLPDGNIFDTANPGDYSLFKSVEPKLAQGLSILREQVLTNAALIEKVKRKYLIKNTVGYSINAFLDYEHSLDIFSHLLIGSEGTLGFIAEATLNTIPDYPHKLTGLLFFEDPAAACNAVPALRDTEPESLELMDRSALRTIEHTKEAPGFFKDLPDGITAILCEYQESSLELLTAKYQHALPVIGSLKLVRPPEFTSDPALQEAYWKIRKGLYPSVASVRAKGTTVLLEDVAVPVHRLGDTVLAIQQLFNKYKYPDAVIFGHAKEGNLHFALSQSFNTPEEAAILQSFTSDLAIIVRENDGSLKAEHGTGRQIAPFVKDEWGEDAYAIMKEVKQLADPLNILNPDVLISEDPQIHIKDLKTMPVVEEEVDKCVECGYCEDCCPSRDYTLTPRQRIIIRRSLRRLSSSKERTIKRQLEKEFAHAGLATCAVDGLCGTACPVGINTGTLVKQLRMESHGSFANGLAVLIAKGLLQIEWMVITAIKTGYFINRLLGKQAMARFTGSIRKIIPVFPLWNDQISRAPIISWQYPENPDILYFPSCITRMMGNDVEKAKSQVDVFMQLSHKAGLQVLLPAEIKGLCCGQIYSSKGFKKAYRYTIEKTIHSLWELSRQGMLPIVLDVTSCTATLLNCRNDLSPAMQEEFDRMTFLDVIDYAHDLMLPKLNIVNRKHTIALHPVCALSRNENQLNKLRSIAAACAEVYYIPPSSGCCGMAGDRGFYYPELIRAATARETNEVKQMPRDGYYATAKTCEMSMSLATGENYRSILYLLNDVIESLY